MILIEIHNKVLYSHLKPDILIDYPHKSGMLSHKLYIL